MIFTLVIGLGLALILGILAQKVKLSPLVGYLLAGMIASGQLWGIEVDSHLVEEFSHMGVILLLFGVGLQFHVKDLLAVRRIVVPGAMLSIVSMTLLGALVYSLFGAESPYAFSPFMYGLCICVSSTVVLTRILSDNRILQTAIGHTAIGWLVVEDIFTIMLLVLLPVLVDIIEGQHGAGMMAMVQATGWMILRLAALVLCVGILGRLVIPRILTLVARSTSSDLFTLTVLVLALGIAALSSYGFDASMEFGAFLSGMVVGQSRFSARAATEALPMKDAFAVLFFVSVGMGFSWSGMVDYWALALATLCLSVLVKPLIALFAILCLRKTSRLAVGVAGTLSQIGEFSFILASLAVASYQLLPLAAANVITGVAIVSITINSILYRHASKLTQFLENRGIGLLHSKNTEQVEAPHDDRHRIIVIGYGPCGQLCTRILQENDMDVVVLEMNIDTVNKLCQEGIVAIFGDARHRSILETAGVEKARAIIITASAAPSLEIAHAATALNPEIRVMAHTSYINDALRLREEGAQTVFSGEEEVALTMTSFLLRSFGATEEQVGYERRRARRMLSQGEVE